MTGAHPPDPRDDLDARIRAARAARPQPSQDGGGGGPVRGVGFAFRVGVELVAALAVGVGIGVGLDRWLGTDPWLMVTFFFLGASAGILNVYRAISVMLGNTGESATESPPEARNDQGRGKSGKTKD